MRVRLELAALPARVVRVEVEASPAGLLQQHHPHRRPALGCRRRERHRLGRGEACVTRFREPALELLQRVGIQVSLVHSGENMHLSDVADR